MEVAFTTTYMHKTDILYHKRARKYTDWLRQLDFYHGLRSAYSEYRYAGMAAVKS